MDLAINVLAKVLSECKVKVAFENLEFNNASEIAEQASCKIILKIRKILDNDTLDDFECIERIVRLLDEMGVGGGSRHDFG